MKIFHIQLQLIQSKIYRPAQGVPLTSKYLWSDEVGSIARCHEQTVLRSQLLRKAKVDNPQGCWAVRLVTVHNVTGL